MLPLLACDQDAWHGLPESMKAIVLFFGRYSLWLVMASALGSTAVLLAIHVEDAPFDFAFKYVSLPVALVIAGFGLRYIDGLKAQCDTDSKYWVSLVAVTLFLAGSMPGWFILANAVIPPQTPYVLTGVVTDKWTTYFKGTTEPWITISGYPEKIEVSDHLYASLAVGEKFSQRRIMGSFGFSYNWDGYAPDR